MVIGKRIKKIDLELNILQERMEKIKYMQDFGKIMKDMDMEFYFIKWRKKKILLLYGKRIK